MMKITDVQMIIIHRSLILCAQTFTVIPYLYLSSIAFFKGLPSFLPVSKVTKREYASEDNITDVTLVSNLIKCGLSLFSPQPSYNNFYFFFVYGIVLTKIMNQLHFNKTVVFACQNYLVFIQNQIFNYNIYFCKLSMVSKSIFMRCLISLFTEDFSLELYIFVYHLVHLVSLIYLILNSIIKNKIKFECYQVFYPLILRHLF